MPVVGPVEPAQLIFDKVSGDVLKILCSIIIEKNFHYGAGYVLGVFRLGSPPESHPMIQPASPGRQLLAEGRQLAAIVFTAGIYAPFHPVVLGLQAGDLVFELRYQGTRRHKVITERDEPHSIDNINKRMKINRLIALALTAVLGVTSLTFTGCTTTSTGTKVLDPAAAAKFAPILRTTVAGAVVYAYSKDKNSVTYIAVIQSALQEFVLSTNMSPSALQAKIYALPVKELKTPEAQLIITPLLSAYAAFGQQYVQAGLNEQVGWKLLAQALVDGVSDGLQGVAQIKQGAGQ